jgi:voltage-gated potassium channel
VDIISGTLKQLYGALLVLVAVLSIGVVGFIYFEDYTLLEAFYMTVITLSTVGFSEVKPLSEAGQLFTSLLIISSFGIFAYGFSAVAQSVFSGQLGLYLKNRKLMKKLSSLQNHVIICGFGRNGRTALQRLKAYGIEVVVIENVEETIDKYLRNTDILYVNGDATTDEALEQAYVGKASALITTLSKDADNLFVVISAKALNNKLRLVSRASNVSTEKKLRSAGANAVVMPEAVGGAHMATLIKSEDLVEFLNHISVDGNSETNLEEINLTEIDIGKTPNTLNDLAIRQATGCNVIGLKDAHGKFIVNPGGDQVLEANSHLFVLGNTQQIEKLNAHLKIDKRHTFT